MRDRATPRTQFVDAVDRLAAHIAQAVFAYLPHAAHVVQTPRERYTGVKLGTNVSAPLTHLHPLTQIHTQLLCAVAIQRSGSLFNHGLRRIFPDVEMGSMLIQHDTEGGEPALYHHTLPRSVKDSQSAGAVYVLLSDSQCGTGAAAYMAIRVLLDHGVQEGHIIFLTFLVARRGGVHAIHKAFPGIRILTAAADPVLREVEVPISGEKQTQYGRRTSVVSLEVPERKKYWQIVPGMGNVGDRYYGTV